MSSTFAAYQQYRFGMQIVTLQNDILSASLSPNAQAAVFAQSKERHWQHAVNTSIAKAKQALLRYAQSPALSQHIEFKLYDLAGDMLHTIASKPNVVIVGATGSQSAVRSLLVPAREPQIQQVVSLSSYPDRANATWLLCMTGWGKPQMPCTCLQHCMPDYWRTP